MPLSKIANNAIEASSQYTGFKNRIINGAMMIDQRNAGASFTNSVGTLYTIDRWMSTGVGSSVTTQQVTGSTGNNKALRLTGASGNADAQLSQKIESWNILDLAGQSVTVSFTLSGSSSGTVYLRRLYPTATDNYTSFTEPDSSIAINFTTTPTQYTATFTLGANANKGLWLVFDFGAVGAAATRTLENVQLEKGSTATSFDYRPYGTELALCQRYYWQIYSAGATEFFFQGYMYSTTQLEGIVSFPVPMRAIPTVTSSPVSQFLLRIQGGTPGSVNGYAVNRGSGPVTEMLIYTASNTVALTVGYGSSLISSGTTPTFIGFSAEL